MVSTGVANGRWADDPRRVPAGELPIWRGHAISEAEALIDDPSRPSAPPVCTAPRA